MKLSYARDNISRNKLDSRISTVLALEHGEVIPRRSLDPEAVYDFLMCNPPFYASLSQMNNLREIKKTPRRSVSMRTIISHGYRADMRRVLHQNFGGIVSDLVTRGGEVHLVLRIIFESSSLRHKIR